LLLLPRKDSDDMEQNPWNIYMYIYMLYEICNGGQIRTTTTLYSRLYHSFIYVMN
jgi:hypothetical protein